MPLYKAAGVNQSRPHFLLKGGEDKILEKEKLMLYFHIPFCVSKCAYCAFFSTPKWDGALLDAYTEALVCQINAFENSGDYKVSSVYFGGGTPSVLGAERLCKALKAVFARFEVEKGAEITVELNPGTVDEEALKDIRGGGFNRLSLGVQSFNDTTLKLLNRAHSAKDAVQCIESARRAGFDNISADLIFALPKETEESLTYSINRLIELKPQHISVYGLTLEEGTPLWESKNKYAFPTEDGEEAQYEALCKLLGEQGYLHYEISNFALPGYASRHNTGYWHRTPYFGFGAGAHSFFLNRRFETPPDIAEYIKRVGGGYLAPTTIEKAAVITEKEAEAERIMLGLRLSEGVAMPYSKVPKGVTENGLGVYKEGRFSLTEKGYRVSNAIIGMILG